MAITPNKENKMDTMIIIGSFVAFILTVCGIMVTIPAPHTYAGNTKIKEPVLVLPPDLIINSGNRYPLRYEPEVQESPSQYIRDLITAMCETWKEEGYSDRWINNALDNNRQILRFSEDNNMQPHDFRSSVIDISQGKKEEE